LRICHEHGPAWSKSGVGSCPALGSLAGAGHVRGRWRRGRGASASLCQGSGHKRARNPPRSQRSEARRLRLPQGQPVEVVKGDPSASVSDVCRSSSGEALREPEARATGRSRAPQRRKNVRAALNSSSTTRPRSGSSASRDRRAWPGRGWIRGRKTRRRPRSSGHLACQGRLADLACAQQGHHRLSTAGGEPRRHGAVVRSSAIRLPIRLHAPLKIHSLPTNFQPWNPPTSGAVGSAFCNSAGKNPRRARTWPLTGSGAPGRAVGAACPVQGRAPGGRDMAGQRGFDPIAIVDVPMPCRALRASGLTDCWRRSRRRSTRASVSMDSPTAGT